EVAGVVSPEAERRGEKLQNNVFGARGKEAVSAATLSDIGAKDGGDVGEDTARGGHLSVGAAEEEGSRKERGGDDEPGTRGARQDTECDGRWKQNTGSRNRILRRPRARRWRASSRIWCCWTWCCRARTDCRSYAG